MIKQIVEKLLTGARPLARATLRVQHKSERPQLYPLDCVHIGHYRLKGHCIDDPRSDRPRYWAHHLANCEPAAIILVCETMNQLVSALEGLEEAYADEHQCECDPGDRDGPPWTCPLCEAQGMLAKFNQSEGVALSETNV